MCTTHSRRNDALAARPNIDRTQALELAARIGEEIIRDAIWDDGQCNWMGYEPLANVTEPRQVYSALGADLYGGTSGIALFLSELSALTGDRRAKSTAIGALGHAVECASRLSDEERKGLFSGWVGIALAGARSAVVLDESSLLTRGLDLTRTLTVGPVSDYLDTDLIGGYAGSILGLLAFSQMADDEPSSLSLAKQCGDVLADYFARTGVLLPSRTPRAVKSPYLTGLAHGAAGVGSAMSQLQQAVGDPRYGEVARLAFDYENCYFDARVGNWTDLRQAQVEQGSDHSTSGLASFTNAWCYGAAGIALSRMRASKLNEAEALSFHVRAGLETSAAGLRLMVEEPVRDFSLCHGVAGVADVVHEGLWATGRNLGGGEECLNDVVAQAFRKYLTVDGGLPCGTRSGSTPSLMLGMAGIGHFFLRLGAVGVPSILLPDRTGWLAIPRAA